MISYIVEFSYNLKKIGMLVVLLTSQFMFYAQEPNENDEIDNLLDELFFNEDVFIDEIFASYKKSNFIYTSTTYSSNTFFSGRDSGFDQFNLVPQISYYHKSGISISLSGLYYELFEPNWNLTGLSIAFQNTLGKKEIINYSTAYTRYIYSDGLNTFTNSLDASIGIKNKNRKIGSEVIASYLFGNEQAIQFISSTFGKLTIKKDKKYHVTLNPQLNFIIAKQTIALEELNNQVTEYIDYEIFDLLNTQIKLPLSLTTKSWDASLGYTINIPKAIETENNLPTTGFFNLSVGYLIDFKR